MKDSNMNVFRLILEQLPKTYRYLLSRAKHIKGRPTQHPFSLQSTEQWEETWMSFVFPWGFIELNSIMPKFMILYQIIIIANSLKS